MINIEPATQPSSQRPARGRYGTLMLVLLATTGLPSGCAVPLSQACPHCQTLTLGTRPPVPKGTQTVYLLVPGLLGYGWEWHDAERALRELPAAVTLVWPWDPWRSLAESGTALTEHLDYLLRRLPSAAEVTRLPHTLDHNLALGHLAQQLRREELAARADRSRVSP